MLGLRSAAGRAKRRFVADLRSDPYLVAILAVTVLLAAFYVWHEIPNFATWDERDRILDPLVAYGRVIDQPSLGALREGVIWGREPFGSTFYLYGLALLPVVIAAAVLGDLDAIAALGLPANGSQTFGFWEVWHTTPEWIWTASLLIARLLNVVFAAGAVYLTYRIGTYLRDRTTGRLAGAFLAVTWGLITLAHEGGEDIPSVFVLLLALYLLIQYVETGERRRFFEASAVGAAAMTLKLTVAPIVFTIAIAHLLRIYREGDSWRRLFEDQDLLLDGAAVGAVVILLGFPTLLVGGFIEFLSRIIGHPAYRVAVEKGPAAPIWWWFLRGYFNAFGLPLFLASVAGLGGALLTLRKRVTDGSTVLLAYLGLYTLLLTGWHDFRPHHLLSTLPLLVFFLADGLSRLDKSRPAVARSVVAVLLVTSGAYAAVGTAGYASMPRADAVDWMDDNVERNATMEFYTRGFEESATPHWIDAQYPYAGDDRETLDPCPEYVQLSYRDLLYLSDIPDSHRTSYVRHNTEARAAHVRALLNGSYGYEVVAEFGERPPGYVPERPTPGSIAEILSLGIYPQSDQYADEQELRANQYVAILEYNGSCEQPLPRPE
ncbi:ArnT family glycosyltransferase [Halapricum hydrolyticum]|uniref:Glycosyltransferase family 39 protein n=1 Tax=Halapricum hydrolyticum TaxID=2979991 RepID=A0AAE3LG09_9EURY|nr:glycosyltransferase family 39 protein [Halapricum hydrolyticum]MCU4719566.1 glycosyltransferase family 39 protein [Halapricum hydrolyticum]MCU4728491.1 glycosyltransferase family 39 protein [Halapricum hydrolyticum]